MQLNREMVSAKLIPDCDNSAEINNIDVEVLGLSLFPSADMDN